MASARKENWSSSTTRAELDAHRIENDWTWLQLSQAMKRKGITMSPRTLHWLLKRAPIDAKPLDRTLYKVRLYLKRTAAARRGTKRRVEAVTNAPATV